MLTVKEKKKREIDVKKNIKEKVKIWHTAPLPRGNRDYHVIKNTYCTHKTGSHYKQHFLTCFFLRLTTCVGDFPFCVYRTA